MLVHLSTISLCSKNMHDLRMKLAELLKHAERDGRAYKVSPYYEPVPGYVGVDVELFLPDQAAKELRMVEEFSGVESKSRILH